MPCALHLTGWAAAPMHWLRWDMRAAQLQLGCLCVSHHRAAASLSSILRRPHRQRHKTEDAEWTPGSRRCGVMAIKCGMTATWTHWGERVPVTVLYVPENKVIQVR